MKNKIKIHYLAWLANLVIIVLSLAPIGDQIPKPIERSDLIYHALAYAVTSLLFQLSFKRRHLQIITLLICQGVLIEYIQPYVGRFFELWDMLANTAGVSIGWIVYYIFRRPSSKSSTGPSR